MLKPKLQWFGKIKSDTAYEGTNDFFAGTYDGKDPLSVSIQLWNNRWGKEDCEDLKNFYITMSFKDFEDNALLEYCHVTVNGSEVIYPEIANKIATLPIPNSIVIKGTKNDGTAEKNKSNYLQLDFVFQAPEVHLKENDLKTIVFNIIEE